LTQNNDQTDNKQSYLPHLDEEKFFNLPHLNDVGKNLTALGKEIKCNVYWGQSKKLIKEGHKNSNNSSNQELINYSVPSSKNQPKRFSSKMPGTYSYILSRSHMGSQRVLGKVDSKKNISSSKEKADKAYSSPDDLQLKLKNVNKFLVEKGEGLVEDEKMSSQRLKNSLKNLPTKEKVGSPYQNTSDLIKCVTANRPHRSTKNISLMEGVDQSPLINGRKKGQTFQMASNATQKFEKLEKNTPNTDSGNIRAISDLVEQMFDHQSPHPATQHSKKRKLNPYTDRATLQPLNLQAFSKLKQQTLQNMAAGLPFNQNKRQDLIATKAQE